MSAGAMPHVRRFDDLRPGMDGLEDGLFGVQPRAMAGPGRGWHRRPLRSLRGADRAETSIPHPAALLQPPLQRERLHEAAPGATHGMTPTRYCFPEPCPNGHPIGVVRRIRWDFAGTSRWRCGACGDVWERPSREYPPSVAAQFPQTFKRLRELNQHGTAFRRLAGAMRFWMEFEGESP